VDPEHSSGCDSEFVSREEKMKQRWLSLALAFVFASGFAANSQTLQNGGPQALTSEQSQFHWPQGKRAAVSMSFDDARVSQMDTGLALFKQENVKVTFFVQPGGVKKRLDAWKMAVADGHEIASHTITHPCSGNYFAKDNALENYTLQKIANELDGNNQQIHDLLGVTPKDFAYPCGQKFVGRGLDSKSYVPLVAERFLIGRGYMDEMPNDPGFFDFARAMGTAFDDTDFAEMKTVVDKAAQNGSWVIFVGHDIGTRGRQITDVEALKQLCAYLKDPANGIWLGTVDEIGSYVHKQRETAHSNP
jgi:peptidoglycan/xylan/chitin deacetylase (PgdA/CDA1 family)